MDKKSDETEIAVIATDVKHLIKELSDFKREIKSEIKSLKNTYVTKAEFSPIKNIVYGLVGTILVSVVGALLTLVLRQ